MALFVNGIIGIYKMNHEINLKKCEPDVFALMLLFESDTAIITVKDQYLSIAARNLKKSLSNP